jgi:hypothetical protein
MIEVFKLLKIDEDIVRNIKELALQANPRAKNTRYGREKWVCRKMLAKRLPAGISVNGNKGSCPQVTENCKHKSFSTFSLNVGNTLVFQIRSMTHRHSLIKISA